MDPAKSIREIIGRSAKKAKDLAIRSYNTIRRSEPYKPPTDVKALRQVQSRSRIRTDISDHLETLFIESLHVDPDTIIELGVRGGESTSVFEKVATLCDSTIVSVDVNDCSGVSNHPHWNFVQADDVEFAQEFETWSEEQGMDAGVDVLFIDTSHLYPHTVDEIKAWFPLLQRPSVVFFHDTNLSRYTRHRDGTIGQGWDNQRGVIRALEEYLGQPLNEREEFQTILSGFLVKHFPYSHGLTVLHRPSADVFHGGPEESEPRTKPEEDD